MNEENNQYELEIDVPMYIELRSLPLTNNDYGAFTKISLKPDLFVGSFKGKIRKSMTQCAHPEYVWTIFSSRNIPLFYIDGSDPRESNWLRFIRSTNDINKQNIVCMQQNQQINYFTSKEIKCGDELLTYFPEKKKKLKRAAKSDDLTIMTRTRSSFQQKLKSFDNSSTTSTISSTASPARTWTCQLCKKQFDQRVDLCKHQCIEHNLKLLKKKKDIRKKRWREAHWKRKIDLSYIETTSLTQSSHNIVENLSFCIDGTNEDLKVYSKEVKDYLNSELGTETQVQMFLKCCFPDVYKKLAAVPSALLTLDANLVNKSNSYFIDIIYTPNKPIESTTNSITKTQFRLLNSTLNSLVYNCKNCKLKCFTMTDLLKHHRDVHNTVLKTTFDCFNRENNIEYWSSINENSNSPIGYFGCDPFAYLFNLHWDQTIELKCSTCNNTFTRPKFAQHLTECPNQPDSLSNKKDITENNSDCTQLQSIEETRPQENYLLICFQSIEFIISKIEADEKLADEPRSNEAEYENHISADYKILNEQLNIPITKVKRAYKRKADSDKKLIGKLLNTSNENEDSPRDELPEPVLKKKKNRDYRVTTVTNRKIYECEKCALEFTSSNSVIRHQEKSCLRVKVINLTSELNIDNEIHVINKKKCPICSSVFLNTHRLSIHIYKHHGSLLGSAAMPPATEALYPNLNNNSNHKNTNRLMNSEDPDVDIVYYE